MTGRAVHIPVGNDWLYGFLHVPDDQPRGAVLLCAPLFEERKSAHRAWVECAETLRRAGWLALRFDYRGCGDSAGEFADFAPTDWSDDIGGATDWLRNETDVPSLVLLGLRLGASLALRCAARCRARALVLWEPTLVGSRYLREELRKKLMKEITTSGQGQTSREDLMREMDAGGTVDFDGYAVAPRLYRELNELDLLAEPPPFCGHALLVHIAHRDRPSSQHRALGDALVAGGAQAHCVSAVLQPFWNLIGYTDIGDLTQTTLQWMNTAVRAPSPAAAPTQGVTSHQSRHR
jgi:exosortase A-associated hydrolase 2